MVGVLTLYHSDRDAFTKDHLRILLAINAKIALSIENALRFRQAETSATTDYLTGLPNARSLVPATGRRAVAQPPQQAADGGADAWIWTDSNRSTTASGTWKATASCAPSAPD